MKYRVGDVIRLSLRNNEGDWTRGPSSHIDDGENFLIRYPDAIEITSHTDLVERDEIIDHIPKKAAEKGSAAEGLVVMKPSG